MTDPDPDATGATHSSPTEPLPAQGQAAGPGGPPPPAGRPRWWTWQVAAVAVVALVAGLAIGALTWSSDGDETAAVANSTTSEPPSTTTSEAPTTTAPEPGTTADQEREGEQQESEERAIEERESEEEVREGRTVVGNSSNVFTGSYSSNRDKATDEFTVEDNWTVRWEVDAGSITIAILDAGGNEVDRFDAQGEGETHIADGGTYRLDITTDGSRYTVVATDGP